SAPVLSVIRRELKRLQPDSGVTVEELARLLPDVLKRELLEGDDASEAKKSVAKASSRTLRKRSTKKVPKESSVKGAPKGSA
ncbi:MAG: restriction endonuclease subunit R, partial [Bacteroidota bacterium]